MSRPYDAVVFDFGGVLIPSIKNPFAQLADHLGCPLDVLFEVMMGPQRTSTDHPWHRLERGEILLDELQPALEPVARDAGLSFHGDEVERLLSSDHQYDVDLDMLARVDQLRRAGYEVGLLTNIYAEYRPVLEQTIDLGRFDVVVDSATAGCRKPEAQIYELLLDELGDPDPARVLYFDDFEGNVAGARRAGITTVHVTDRDVVMGELQNLA